MGKPTWWHSDSVRVALVTAIASVLVGVLGLIGVLATRDDPSASVGQGDQDDADVEEPLLAVSSVKFTPADDNTEDLPAAEAFDAEAGSLDVEVAGTVHPSFPRRSLVIAIVWPESAKPSTRTWWASDPVAPELSRDWSALVVGVEPPEGQGLEVSAIVASASLVAQLESTPISSDLPDDGPTSEAGGIISHTEPRWASPIRLRELFVLSDFVADTFEFDQSTSVE